MNLENEFKNETDYNILIFWSDQKYSHKSLYRYMPKLTEMLQKLTIRFKSDEDIESDMDNLAEYIRKSAEPELKFSKYLYPGDYTLVPKFAYIYAVSIIQYNRAINPRVSIAIDITENQFDGESVDIIDKRGLTRIKESAVHNRNPELTNRAYMTGREEMRKISVWKLTRHPFSYIVIDPKSTADMIWGKSTNVIPWWCLVVIILFIILAGILFFGLYYITQYSDILSDRELNNLL